ncbi:MAG: hypothetical protein M3433_08540, partial [Actinomycetota bacterium]|nr:hypothetical protein [Actinomycetota bacterium]
KMETAVFADIDGEVEEVVAEVGAHVDGEELLLVVQAADGEGDDEADDETDEGDGEADGEGDDQADDETGDTDGETDDQADG